MQIPRPSQETMELFRSVVPEAPGVEVKPMFANLGAFVNGNMFAGLFGESVGVRLPDEAVREQLLAIDGTGPYGPAERPMGGYVTLPATLGDAQAQQWIARSLTYVGALPAKKKKK